MAGTPIPSGFGICSMKYRLAGRTNPYAITFGFTDDGASSASTQAASLVATWLARFTAATSFSSYTYEGCHITYRRGGVLFSADNVQSTAGTVVGAESSPAISIVVKKLTGFAGKKFRGRMYLPPAFLGEANVSNAGIIDAATVTSRQTICSNWLADMIAGANDPVLLHRDGSAPTAITQLSVESMVGTQRRRQRH